MSNYLAGMVSLDQIIHPTNEHENISFIPSGSIPPNPSELMSGKRMKDLLVEIRKDYREACTAFRVDSDYVPIFESKFVSKLVIRCALMFDIF